MTSINASFVLIDVGFESSSLIDTRVALAMGVYQTDELIHHTNASRYSTINSFGTKADQFIHQENSKAKSRAGVLTKIRNMMIALKSNTMVPQQLSGSSTAFL